MDNQALNKKNESGSKFGHLIVSELRHEPQMSADFREIYQRFARRVLWIDDDLVPGSMQMNVSWYNKAPELDPIFEEHTHEAAEIIGFFGSDPENPYELCGEVQIDIDGEPHVITSSSLIFIPPGLPHALHLRRIDKPIFHFSVMSGGHYNGSAYN